MFAEKATESSANPYFKSESSLGEMDFDEYIDMLEANLVELDETDEENDIEDNGSREEDEPEDNNNISDKKPAFKIRVVNVCSFANLKCHLRLQDIARRGMNVEYDARANHLIMRLRKPPVAAKIWNSGKISIMGAHSIDDALTGSRRIARQIQKLGYKCKFCKYAITNMMCRVRFPLKVDLVKVVSMDLLRMTYEPELNPALQFYLNPKNKGRKYNQTKSMAHLFSNGKCILISDSLKDVAVIVDTLYEYCIKSEVPSRPIYLHETDFERNRNKRKMVRLTNYDEQVAASSMANKAKSTSEQTVNKNGETDSLSDTDDFLNSLLNDNTKETSDNLSNHHTLQSPINSFAYSTSTHSTAQPSPHSSSKPNAAAISSNLSSRRRIRVIQLHKPVSNESSLAPGIQLLPTDESQASQACANAASTSVAQQPQPVNHTSSCLPTLATDALNENDNEEFSSHDEEEERELEAFYREHAGSDFEDDEIEEQNL